MMSTMQISPLDRYPRLRQQTEVEWDKTDKSLFAATESVTQSIEATELAGWLEAIDTTLHSLDEVS